MMKITSQAKKEIEEAFGPIANFTTRQLWILVKMMKHARLRCRNNSALNNWMNGVFGEKFNFKQVNKQRPSRYNPAVMETYPGLSIVDKTTGNEDNADESED